MHWAVIAYILKCIVRLVLNQWVDLRRGKSERGRQEWGFYQEGG